MSGLWVLGLGASLGYLFTKKEAIASKLDVAVREYDKDHFPDTMPDAPSGATSRDIKAALRHTQDTKEIHMHEKLPASDRAKLVRGEDNLKRVESAYDSPRGVTEIVGVYLEH